MAADTFDPMDEEHQAWRAQIEALVAVALKAEEPATAQAA